MTDPNETPDDRVARPHANGKRPPDPLEDRLRQLETRLAELSAEPRRLAAADGLLLDPPAGAAPLALAAPPSGAVLHPPELSDPLGRRWLFAQVVAEVRLVLRMYFDPRYRVSRTTQFALPAVGVLFVFNYFFFAVWFPVWLVAPVLERALCVLLGVFAYQLLRRELARYRAVLDYLDRHGFR